MIRKIFHIAFLALVYVGILAGSVTKSMINIGHLLNNQESTIVTSGYTKSDLLGLLMELEESEETNTEEDHNNNNNTLEDFSHNFSSSIISLQGKHIYYYYTQKAKKCAYQKAFYKHSTKPKIYLSQHKLKIYC